MILIYGWMFIGSSILIVALGRLLLAEIKKPGLWSNGYFWLLAGVWLMALASGEIGASRVLQTFDGGIRYAQAPALAILAGFTATLAIVFKMRALTINSPRVGSLFLWLCAVWVAVVAAVAFMGGFE